MASVLDQEAEGGRGLCVRHPLPVVDHQGDAVVLLVYLVDQRCQHVTAGVVPVLLEHLEQGGGEGWAPPPDRFEQMSKEPHHVVVVVVDGQPADRDTVAREVVAPLRRQRALAKTRWRVDEDKASPAARPQSVDQPVAGEHRSDGNLGPVLRRGCRWRWRGGQVAPHRSRRWLSALYAQLNGPCHLIDFCACSALNLT